MKRLQRFVFTAAVLTILLSVSIFPLKAQSSHYYSHNYVTALYAVDDNLWIGYDCGLESRTISSNMSDLFFKNNSGLPYDYVTSIIADLNGNKWIVTGGYSTRVQNSLTKFNGTNWTVFNSSNSPLPPGDITALITDKVGTLWLGVYEKLVKFDGQNWTVYNSDTMGFDIGRITSLAADKKGNIWIASYGGITKFDGTNWKHEHQDIEGNFINDANSVTVDSSGNVWFTHKGLYKFDGNTWSIYPLESKDRYLTSIFADANNNIWAANNSYFGDDTSGGIIKFDGKDWKNYNKSNSNIPSSSISAITGDKYGNIWIGTCDKSLVKFDGNNWTVYNTSNGIQTNIIRNIFVDNSGKAWFATNIGLYVFNGSAWTLYNKSNSGLNTNEVYAVTAGGSGTAWIGTDMGLVRFDGISWKIFDKSNSGLTSNIVRSVAIDAMGNLWLGTGEDMIDEDKAPGGLVKYDGKNWTVYDRNNSPLPNNYVTLVTIDPKGNKWLVYGQIIHHEWWSGLLKYDDLNWTEMYKLIGWDLHSCLISAAAFDSSGNAWIGGGQYIFGLAKYEGEKWTTYNSSNSPLPGDSVNSIAVDSKGVIWAGTVNGLAAIEGKSWTIYNNSNYPLSSNNITAIFIDKQNNKWIAENGITFIKSETNALPPDVNNNSLIPAEYSLSQNYPNPFNPVTVIKYALPLESSLRLVIYNSLGETVREVFSGTQSAGFHEVSFNASGISSGIYFLILDTKALSGTNVFRKVIKMMVLK